VIVAILIKGFIDEKLKSKKVIKFQNMLIDRILMEQEEFYLNNYLR
jgi:hypothetical protein